MALEILGYDPCLHGFSIFSNIRDAEMWEEGLKAKFSPQESRIAPFGQVELDQLLWKYRALCDMPAACFVPELLAAYPDAKVVLVERDIEAWYESFDKAIIQTVWQPVSEWISWMDQEYLWKLRNLTHTVMRTYFRARGPEELARNARTVYREHYAMVRRLTEKERLLEFKFQDGWEPLCEFLGKPVPDVPFPRVNDADALQEKIEIVSKAALGRILSKFGMVLAGVGAAVASVYWYRR
jgi:hypothetical protein